MSESTLYQLQEVTVNFDSRRVPVKSVDRKTGEFPYYGASGIVDYVDDYIFDGEYLLIAEDGENLRTRKTPIAFMATGRFWVNNHAHVVQGNRLANTRYLGYALANTDISGYLSGSTQPKLTQAALNAIRLHLPSRRYQDAVIDVLGALDDKIALNERIGQSALDLACALYLQASVDLSWRKVSLGEAARWQSGGTPRTSEPSFWGGPIPWISAASLKSPWIADSDRRVTNLGAQNGTRVVPKGAIIFVVRGMSLKTEFRIGLTQCEVAFGQDCKALLPRGGVDSHVLFHATRAQSDDILGLVDEAGHGTGRLATDRLERMEVSVPADLGDSVVGKLRSLDCLAAEREQESRRLAELRDALLPGLMSGAIRVRDAEKAVEDAT